MNLCHEKILQIMWSGFRSFTPEECLLCRVVITVVDSSNIGYRQSAIYANPTIKNIVLDGVLPKWVLRCLPPLKFKIAGTTVPAPSKIYGTTVPAPSKI